MISSLPVPPHRYIAFIDEAGDTGIKRVRPIDPVGGTEWLTIGCALVRVENEPNLPEYVGNILDKIGVKNRPDLHFRMIKKHRQAETCHLLSKLPTTLFVVCSNKRNIRLYNNERAAAKMHGSQWLYNYLVRVLLERVTAFVYNHSVEQYKEPSFVRFVFSNRGGHSYSQTTAYQFVLKQQARARSALLKYRLPEWRVMHPSMIDVVDHSNCAGLQIADCVASAFYTACDNLDTGPLFLEPAKALRPRIAQESGKIADFGVVLQPNPFSKQISTQVMDGYIPKAQREIFEFYGFTF